MLEDERMKSTSPFSLLLARHSRETQLRGELVSLSLSLVFSFSPSPFKKRKPELHLLTLTHTLFFFTRLCRASLPRRTFSLIHYLLVSFIFQEMEQAGSGM